MLMIESRDWIKNQSYTNVKQVYRDDNVSAITKALRYPWNKFSIVLHVKKYIFEWCIFAIANKHRLFSRICNIAIWFRADYRLSPLAKVVGDAQ